MPAVTKKKTTQMQIYINDKQVGKDQVTANHGMNYGQFRDHYLEISRYELYIDKQEYFSVVREDFEQTKKDI